MAVTQLSAIKSLPYLISNTMAILTCFPMAIGIMIFGKYFCRFFENKMLTAIGTISYEIYLIHAFTLRMIRSSVTSILMFVVVTVALAYVTHFITGKSGGK